MLLEEFDEKDKPIFEPSDMVKKRSDCPKTAVAFFAQNMEDAFLDNFDYEIYETLTCGGRYNVYKFNYNGKDMLFFRISLGAPASVAVMEEITELGVENFLVSGSCGVLEKNINSYTLIVPEKAIRDEGTSYHYAPSSDIVELNKRLVDKVESYLKAYKFEYIRTTSWTTDAIYRETEEKVKRRKEMGAKCVEMECSALASFAKYKGVNFAQVLYGADVVCAGSDYNLRNLLEKEDTSEERILKLVIDMASKIY